MPNVKSKNYRGEYVTYENVEVLHLADADSGELVPFSYGEAISGVPVTLDLADGNQTVEAPVGTLVKSAVIQKPADLVPNNIRDGTEIGGVVGSAFVVDMVETAILEEKTYDDFSEVQGTGIYAPSFAYEFNFVAGETYHVVWDDEEYVCVAYEIDGLTGVGNAAIAGMGEDTGEPFLMGDNGWVAIATLETDASHVIGVSQKTREDVETATVELSMADGDQVIVPTAEGKVLSKVTVRKPEALVAENIRDGVEIAGIVGVYASMGADYVISYMSIDGTEELYAKPIMHGDTAGDVIALGLMDEPAIEDTAEAYYKFIGWSDSIGGEVKTSMFENVTENKTVYAVYEAIALLGSGECGESARWRLTQDGILTISGTGAMTDYSGASAQPWYEHASSINTVIIENGITKIGNQSLRALTSLTSVFIADSVTALGVSAFLGCTALESINLPESIDTIGAYCFNESGLTSITIPSKVTSLNYNFYACTKLKTVVTHDNLTSFGTYTFRGCTALTSITIPGSVTTIGNYVFYGCTALTSINIPGSVTTIGNYAFQNCSKLASVQLGDGLTSLGNYAFRYCTALTSINIPGSVTTFGNGVFEGCSKLASVTFGNGLTSIGYAAFYNCTSLTMVEIINSVKDVGSFAFYGCTALKTVHFGSGITLIAPYAFYGTALTQAWFKSGGSWFVTTNQAATSGTNIVVTNMSTTATYLKMTYADYYWKRK